MSRRARCTAWAAAGHDRVVCARPAGHDGRHEGRVGDGEAAVVLSWSTEDKRGDPIPKTGWGEA